MSRPAGSAMSIWCCFPQLIEDTRQFLVDDFTGRFQLHLFGMSDETMPLWSDRELLQITVDDPYDSDSAWAHIGMNSDEARALQASTLDEVRRRNDSAVYLYWQGRYEEALLPDAAAATNLAVEKSIERLAMIARDHPDIDAGAAEVRAELAKLAHFRRDTEPDGRPAVRSCRLMI
jgi:anaerobic magnesium-protoporphyrin IX monomethyl ester cyclase